MAEYSESKIREALYNTHHRNGQRVEAFIHDLAHQLLTQQHGFDPKRPFGNSDWHAWIREAAQVLEPDAEASGAQCNEEYRQAVGALLGYIFEVAKNAGASCGWEYQQVEDAWETSCGEMFQFISGGPEENGVEYCPYCGSEVTA